MPVFNLTAAITVSAYTRVEADTLDKALEIAEERPAIIDRPALADSFWVVNDADGMAQDIRNEE